MFFPKRNLPIPTVPEEISKIFESVDQHTTWKLNLGPSLNDILTEEDTPLAKHLTKGFEVSMNMEFASNAKKAILEVLKDDDQQAL